VRSPTTWRHEPGPDGPRFFELTDDNPHGQWSSYTIGDTFSGVFPVSSLADPTDRALVRGTGCRSGRADGGPLRLLDLDGARRQAQRTAAARYMRWCEIEAADPGARSLADLTAGQTAAERRSSHPATVFEAQPQVTRARADRLVDAREDPVAIFAAPDRLFEEAGLRAVTGAALVTTDGDWIGDPSSYYSPSPRREDSLAYLRTANAYLDSLGSDSLIVLASLRR
jgi:hypothetical protein